MNLRHVLITAAALSVASLSLTPPVHANDAVAVEPARPDGRPVCREGRRLYNPGRITPTRYCVRATKDAELAARVARGQHPAK
jgi:hypothetical protein